MNKTFVSSVWTESQLSSFLYAHPCKNDYIEMLFGFLFFSNNLRRSFCMGIVRNPVRAMAGLEWRGLVKIFYARKLCIIIDLSIIAWLSQYGQDFLNYFINMYATKCIVTKKIRAGIQYYYEEKIDTTWQWNHFLRLIRYYLSNFVSEVFYRLQFDFPKRHRTSVKTHKT